MDVIWSQQFSKLISRKFQVAEKPLFHTVKNLKLLGQKIKLATLIEILLTENDVSFF